MPTIGEKIKSARALAGLTQSELCGDRLTRNMLSQIESGKAQPSLATLEYLSERLSLSAAYLIDPDQTLNDYKKRELLPEIKKHLSGGNYQKCIDLCKKLDGDDEIMLIVAKCYSELGSAHYKKGWLEGARRAFVLAEDAASKTIYPTDDITAICHTMLEMTDALVSGRLADVRGVQDGECEHVCELSAYTEMLAIIEKGDYELAAKVYDATRLDDPLYRTHISAKLSMSSGNYKRAISLLCELCERFDAEFDDIPFRYNVYRDLEASCKAIGDYKGAYEYAEARRALSSGFGIGVK